MMEREGKRLNNLKPGDRRRVSDAKNALRKATPEQRREILLWVAEELGATRGAAPGRWINGHEFCLIPYVDADGKELS